MANKIPTYQRPRTAAFIPHQKRELDSQVQCRRWRKLRRAFLEKNPLCFCCEADGRVEAADQVHHRIDRAERPDLAFEWSNLQALCASCHSKITNERKHHD
jgi:5-methylcytosine-specific restriction protein A